MTVACHRKRGLIRGSSQQTRVQFSAEICNSFLSFSRPPTHAGRPQLRRSVLAASVRCSCRSVQKRVACCMRLVLGPARSRERKACCVIDCGVQSSAHRSDPSAPRRCAQFCDSGPCSRRGLCRAVWGSLHTPDLRPILACAATAVVNGARCRERYRELASAVNRQHRVTLLQDAHGDLTSHTAGWYGSLPTTTPAISARNARSVQRARTTANFAVADNGSASQSHAHRDGLSRSSRCCTTSTWLAFSVAVGPSAGCVLSTWNEPGGYTLPGTRLAPWK